MATSNCISNLHTKVADFRTLIDKNAALLEHPAVCGKVKEDEGATIQAAYTELVDKVTDVEKRARKGNPNIPADVLESRLKTYVDMAASAIAKKHGHVEQLFSKCRDLIIEYRMNAEEHEGRLPPGWRGRSDEGQRYWVCILAGEKHAMRQSYEGALYVVGKAAPIMGGGIDIARFDTPVLYSVYAPTQPLLAPAAAPVHAPVHAPTVAPAPSDYLRDPKNNLLNHPYGEFNVKCTYIQKDGKWTNLREGKKKAWAAAMLATQQYACEFHDIEDTYDHMVVRFVSSHTAHYFKTFDKGKRTIVLIDKDTKVAITAASKAMFDRFL
jgi:hypothetical protein